MPSLLYSQIVQKSLKKSNELKEPEKLEKREKEYEKEHEKKYEKEHEKEYDSSLFIAKLNGSIHNGFYENSERGLSTQ
ncbi:unnamed protein product [Rhizophagus irregularis]|nr:unnamed protein product [Rhizophagus irregularis]